jgi:hypothetical protein
MPPMPYNIVKNGKKATVPRIISAKTADVSLSQTMKKLTGVASPV